MVDTEVVKTVEVLMKVVVTGSVTVMLGVSSSGGGASEVGCSGSSSEVAVVSTGVVVGSGSGVGGSDSSGSSVGVGSTGQIVVETGMVSVTTVVEPSGHSGTSGPQSVTVRVEVVKMVDVVMVVVLGSGSSVGSGVGSGSGSSSVGSGSGVVVVGAGVSEGSSESTVVVGSGSVSVSVSVIGQTVVEMGIVSVTIMVEPPSGQSGTSGPQSVTVRVDVVKIVEVVMEVVLGSGSSVGSGAGSVSVAVVGAGVSEGSSDDCSVVGSGSDSVSVMGHTVVEMGIVSVTMMVEPPPGQSGTSGPQSVTVCVVVVKMVEVVILWEVGVVGVDPGSDVGSGVGVSLGSSEDCSVVGSGSGSSVGSGSVSVSVSVMGQTVVEMGIVSVTTVVESAGQSGISGAHDVTV